MKLIITRPRGDSEALARRLATKGHAAIFCPLLAIVPRQNPDLPEAPFQAVCASSANGLDAKLNWAQLVTLPFFAVGPQSAEAAQRRGFTTIKTANTGNLPGLAELIVTEATPKDGSILYLSGSEVSGDLVGLLQARNITVERLIVYDAEALPVPDMAQVVDGAQGVLLYSARSARLWLKAAMQAGVLPNINHLQHYCLSRNVASQLPQSLPMSVAPRPDDGGMMELLDRAGEAE